MLEYPYIFAISGYSDMADLEEGPNNLGEEGSPNGSPFVRLEAVEGPRLVIAGLSKPFAQVRLCYLTS